MRIPSYLVCNKYGQFHFRICFLPNIPLSSERLVFKKTLKTKDKELAVSLARAIKVRIDHLNLVNPLLKMNWSETKAVLNKIVEDTIEEYQSVILEKGTYGDHIAAYPTAPLEKQAVEFIMKKSRKIPVTIEEYPLLKDFVDKVIINYRLDADPEKYDRNTNQVAEMLFKTRFRRFQTIESLYRSIPQLYEEVVEQFKPDTYEDLLSKLLIKDSCTVRDSDTKDAKEIDAKKRVLLNDLVSDFVEYKITKKMWKSPKTIELNRMKLKYISNVLEYIKKTDCIYVDEFTKADAVSFEKIFQHLPANLSKLTNSNCDIKITISNVLSGDIKAASSISPLTYNGYCDLLVGLFNWATLPKQGYIINHPFIDLKIKNVRSKRREPFTGEDIKLFFNTDTFLKKEFELKYAWKFYVPIIMAYSGMRLEEVCQLQIKNIAKFDGVDCFDLKEEIDPETGFFITRLKNTESSNRIIPIHPCIKRSGFFRYLKKLNSLGEIKVFPDLSNKTKSNTYQKAGAKVSKYFNEDDLKNHKKSYLSKCGINSEGKQRKVLYVFRHTVETILINHKQDIEHDKIDFLLGHQVTSIGRNNYGTYNPATLLKVVNYIQYPYSSLPWDINEEYSKISFRWE